MRAAKSTKTSRSHLLLGQWSRSMGELIEARGRAGFDQVLWQAVRRLVDFDFVMTFAYRDHERPLALGDTLDAARRRVIVADYLNGPYLLDPFFQATLDHVRSGCHRLVSLAPDRFRQSEYYRAHYGRTRIGEEVGFFFALGDDVIGVTSFARWSDSPPLSGTDLQLLRLVEPAIQAICQCHWSQVGPSFALKNGQALGNRTVPGAAPFARAFERFGKPLSGRERQIVTLVLQGHSTESIARHLDISPGTVKIHRKNIYRKLAISTQAELFAAFLGAIA
jgi:DNA-binding CsgD family transcriptional regulator